MLQDFPKELPGVVEKFHPPSNIQHELRNVIGWPTGLTKLSPQQACEWKGLLIGTGETKSSRMSRFALALLVHFKTRDTPTSIRALWILTC